MGMEAPHWGESESDHFKTTSQQRMYELKLNFNNKHHLSVGLLQKIGHQKVRRSTTHFPQSNFMSWTKSDPNYGISQPSSQNYSETPWRFFLQNFGSWPQEGLWNAQLIKPRILEIRDIMNWFKECAAQVLKLRRPMEWVTPLGLPVIQPYVRIEKLGRQLCFLPVRHKQVGKWGHFLEVNCILEKCFSP